LIPNVTLVITGGSTDYDMESFCSIKYGEIIGQLEETSEKEL
jgi:hypothetical protein